jgi:hypothetical protein
VWQFFAAGKPVYFAEMEDRWPTWAGFLLGVCANAWRYGALPIRKAGWSVDALPWAGCPVPPYYPPPSRPAFPPADWSSLGFVRALSHSGAVGSLAQEYLEASVFFLGPDNMTRPKVMVAVQDGLMPVCQVRWATAACIHLGQMHCSRHMQEGCSYCTCKRRWRQCLVG